MPTIQYSKGRLPGYSPVVCTCARIVKRMDRWGTKKRRWKGSNLNYNSPSLIDDEWRSGLLGQRIRCNMLFETDLVHLAINSNIVTYEENHRWGERISC